MSHTQLTHESNDLKKNKISISLILHDFDIKLNIGSVFRLADAFACEHVYLTGTTSIPPHRKITKTSRSAEKYVDYSYFDSPLELISQLKKQAYKVISLELTNKSIDLSDLQLNAGEKTCLILGSENAGVNQELLDASEQVVHIPMHGHLSSLNVATATGIALFQLTQLINK